MERTKKYNWSQFSKDIEVLSAEILPFKSFIKNIYGVPRGGLVVAVALSHRLDIQIELNKDKIDKGTLVVDEISDSGETLEKLLSDKKYYRIATLWSTPETKMKPDFYCNTKKKQWITFPWEI